MGNKKPVDGCGSVLACVLRNGSISHLRLCVNYVCVISLSHVNTSARFPTASNPHRDRTIPPVLCSVPGTSCAGVHPSALPDCRNRTSGPCLSKMIPASLPRAVSDSDDRRGNVRAQSPFLVCLTCGWQIPVCRKFYTFPGVARVGGCGPYRRDAGIYGRYHSAFVPLPRSARR